MSKQIAKLIARIAENLPEIPGEVMQGWIENPEGLQKVLREALCPPAKKQDLLRQITAVQVGGAERFVAKDRLKEANVGYTGSNFDQLFLNNIKENVEAATLAIHRLETASLDAPILAELGNRAEIQLAHFFELIKKQSKGEAGVLLVNGYANIAYIRGTDGNFWAVYAHWSSDNRSWHLNVSSVGSPSRWLGGRQVLSRDSVT